MKLGETFHLQHVLTLLHKPAEFPELSARSVVMLVVYFCFLGAKSVVTSPHILCSFFYFWNQDKERIGHTAVTDRWSYSVYSCVVLGMICSVWAFNHMSRSRVMPSPVLSCHACNCGKFPCEGNVQTPQEEEEDKCVCLHFYLHFRWMESWIRNVFWGGKPSSTLLH